MSEKTLEFTIPADLSARLAALAEKDGKTVEDVLRQAVAEHVEYWEDYHRTCDALESGADERVMLQVVNE